MVRTPRLPRGTMHIVAMLSATILLGAGALLGGCGDGAPAGASTVVPATITATTGTQAGDATAGVARAYATLRAGPYVSVGTTTLQVDASGVDASLRDQLQAQFASGAASLSTRTRVESPDRVAITQGVDGRSQRVVLYDGQVFASPDGTRWARVTGHAAAAFPQAAPRAGLEPASLFSDLRADGTAPIDGAPAARYSGTIDAATAGEAVRSVIGGFGDLGAAVGNAVQLRSGTVELQVADATDTVVRQDITMGIDVDLDALARAAGRDAAAGLGTIVVTSMASERITDVGGDVVVQKPRASTTVSELVELGRFLAS